MALQFEPEVGHARWFVDGDSDWQRLCSIGPSGFSRYVRVPHPVDDGGVGEEHPDGIALANLLRVLGRHTSTSQDCFFGLWDGYGHVHGGSAVAVLYTTRRPRWRDLWRQGPQLSVPAAFPAEVVQGPRVRIPNRDYLLFRGPLLEAGQWGARGPAWQDAPPRIPNLMWPADHAWFAATDVDNDWTGIGGSPDLLVELLQHPDIDTQRLDPRHWTR
ncbi:MAG TPA: hypothetical protein PLN51_00895 [Ornithinibacter sp.]|nr:hypothetical protein [Ornithinibacter sp.]HQZ08735.1 hypothetical protein [Ornithinibacter sp.]